MIAVERQKGVSHTAHSHKSEDVPLLEDLRIIELKMNSVVARNSTSESRTTRFMFEQSSGVPSFHNLNKHNMMVVKTIRDAKATNEK
jgi:hypothetical protein